MFRHVSVAESFPPSIGHHDRVRQLYETHFRMFDTPLIKRPAYREGAHLRALKSLDLVEQIALPSVEDLSLLTIFHLVERPGFDN